MIESRAQLSLRHVPGAGQHDDRHDCPTSTAWSPTAFTGATSTKSKCGRPGTSCIERPQIWDMLHEHDPSITSAVWFALHSKGCGADLGVHARADPQSRRLGIAVVLHEADRDVRHAARHAGAFSAAAFLGTAVEHQEHGLDLPTRPPGRHAQSRPNFFYIYLPHLDYAAQKFGPDSDAARRALVELDAELARLIAGARRGLCARATAVAGGQRIHDRAGRSRHVSQSRAARGRLARSRQRRRRRAARFQQQPGLGPGRPSVLARVRGRCGRR